VTAAHRIASHRIASHRIAAARAQKKTPMAVVCHGRFLMRALSRLPAVTANTAFWLAGRLLRQPALSAAPA
jgi:hypothetical protein